MKPIKTDETNFTYALRGETSASDLPCRRDGGQVYSTWEVEPEDLLELSADFPRVVLTLYHPNKIGCSLKVGDGPEHCEHELDAEMLMIALGRCWQVSLTLTEREVQVLRDGARIQVMVDLAPPPPISLQLA